MKESDVKRIMAAIIYGDTRYTVVDAVDYAESIYNLIKDKPAKNPKPTPRLTPRPTQGKTTKRKRNKWQLWGNEVGGRCSRLCREYL